MRKSAVLLVCVCLFTLPLLAQAPVLDPASVDHATGSFQGCDPDDNATGHTVAGKALRLRSHGHAFEFLLDLATARQWETALPPRRYDAVPARAV
jgi:hypothetical protein